MYKLEVMPSDIPKVVDEFVVNGVIAADQRDEVMKLFSEWKTKAEATSAYKMLESLRTTVPLPMQQLTKDITLEDAMYLNWAVQESYMNKARRAFRL